MDILINSNMFEFEKKNWKRGYKNIAGIDEAGRGPLAGPVVAAAVIFPKNFVIPGVKDSKLIRPEKRKILYRQIIENCITFGLGIVSESIIDEFNILNATLLAMKIAVEKLELKPDYIIVDGNQFYNSDIPVETIIKGDQKSFTIASASIIAKVVRDYLMGEYHKIYPEYLFEKHKGYGTNEHMELLRRNGFCDIHRKSFSVKL